MAAEAEAAARHEAMVAAHVASAHAHLSVTPGELVSSLPLLPAPLAP